MKNSLAAGLLALALAGIYYYATADIPRSLLSDNVGADGLPKVYALALALLGVVSVAQWFAAHAGASPADAGNATPLLQHVRVLGLLLLGAVYLLLIGSLGYTLTIFLFIAAVALYSGAKPDLKLLLTCAIGGVVFWLVFVKAFGLPLPTGSLWRWLIG
jgi:hypothetical protein